jgi:uncharacterized protein YjiS (DUF1127 family)
MEDAMTNLNLTALKKPGAGHYRQAARAVARPVALLVGHLARAYRARRVTKYLMSLDDHLLKDMGISRCELEAVVFWGQARRSAQAVEDGQPPRRA